MRNPVTLYITRPEKSFNDNLTRNLTHECMQFNNHIDKSMSLNSSGNFLSMVLTLWYAVPIYVVSLVVFSSFFSSDISTMMKHCQ